MHAGAKEVLLRAATGDEIGLNLRSCGGNIKEASILERWDYIFKTMKLAIVIFNEKNQQIFKKAQKTNVNHNLGDNEIV